MPEQSDLETGSGVRVMTPDEEDARTIARAMASSTAGGILRCFQGQELTASDISTALELPIPTVMYHLDALLEAGLIEVSRIRYSVKGREVKIYRQSDQVLIVAPRHADLRAALLKYASLFSITVICTGIATILSGIWISAPQSAEPGYGREVEKTILKEVANAPAEVLSDAVSRSYSTEIPTVSVPAHGLDGGWIPDIALGILIGGCLIIGALICLDLLFRKRNFR